MNGFNYLRDGGKVTIYGRRRVILNDIDACQSAALADIGIVQLPYFSVRDHIRTGRLKRILMSFPTEKLPIHVVYLPNRHLSANVRAFVDWVVELFVKEQQMYMQQCGGSQVACF